MSTFWNWKTAVATLALAVAVGCSGGGESTTPTNEGKTPDAGGTSAAARPTPTAPTVKAEGDTIKIGIVGSLTGDQKPWGDDSIKGAEMAVAEFNAAGGVNGKKIELLIGDSASKPDQAKSATEKLLSDGVIGIVGEVASGNTIQIASAAFEKSVPVVAVGATRTDLTDKGTHVVRVCYTDDFQGPVMAKFAYDDLGLRKVGIITDNKAPYSQGLSKSFEKTFKELGGEIVGEVFYETGQTDFTGPINEIKGKTPDGLFLSGYFPEVGPMAQAIRNSGMKDVKLLGGDGWDSPQILTSGGDAILGAFMCNHYNNKESRPIVQEFLTKYKKENGGKEPATTMAALGYDAMALILDAVKRAKSLDSVALMEALNETEGFEGVSGTINLKGRGGNPDKQALVVEIRPLAEGFQVFRKAYAPSDLVKN
ncbi:MAG: ABC transporter substrate-binding protein [Fimbriimonadaceae bacterium]|nr:ABC transporter substrate-binding protein [Fimbriimonadaceae bacterium]